MIEYVAKGATISPDGKYRYLLWREWRGTHNPDNWHWLGFKDGQGDPVGEPKSCIFVMLNPSTADGDVDDPTIRKCVGFACRWRFEKLVVVNLFAYRATRFADILRLDDEDDPVGVHNAHHVREALDKAGMVVCAWGSHGGYLNQNQTMMGWLDAAGVRRPRALGLTEFGQPRHPLYVPYDNPLIKFDTL